jgi:hypothetical protein
MLSQSTQCKVSLRTDCFLRSSIHSVTESPIEKMLAHFLPMAQRTGNPRKRRKLCFAHRKTFPSRRSNTHDKFSDQPELDN